MRIQHNIMAMNAYRNYNKNTSALAKNLEKLSSGYKINRAGDDAAGLAISEKMRAQITGLEAAQKNVKDGISLVNTAEGAMQEIQDMMNRMVYLATESANGTFDNEVDRKNLQDEVNQLREEIDRIAKSANFNGIKLLDGSLDAESTANISSGSAIQNITVNDFKATGSSPAFEASFITNRPPAATTQTNAKFTISFDDCSINGLASTAKAKFDIDIGGTSFTYEAPASKAGSSMTASDMAKALVSLGKKASSTDVAAVTDGATAATADPKSAKENWDAKFSTLTNATATATSSYLKIGDHYYKATVNGNSVDFVQADYMGSTAGETIHPDYNVSVNVKEGTGHGTLNWQVQKTTAGAGIGSTHQAQAEVRVDFNKLKDGDVLTVGEKNYIFKIGKNGTAAATASQTLIDLSGILESEADLADTDKLKEAMVKIVGDMGAANASTWTAGNGGIVDGKGVLTFQSKSDYVDDAVKVGGKATNDACNMSTEAGVMKQFTSSSKAAAANVTFDIDVTKIKEGDTITINGATIEFTDGATPSKKGNIALNLSKYGLAEGGTISSANSGDVLTALCNAIEKETNSMYSATYDGQKVTITSKDVANTSALEDRVAADVKLDSNSYEGSALTLQIGDTSDDFNQLEVSIKDMHCESLGIDGIDIGTAAGAKAAINVIKDAINEVSSVRGKLGALSNRLDHTANNLSVMRENIQDAESAIRDTDVAEEMMKYTKNNIFNLRKEDKINQRVKKPVFMRLCGEVALGCEECLAA